MDVHEGDGIACSQQLSDPFKNMYLASQQQQQQQIKAPVPLFSASQQHQEQQGISPLGGPDVPVSQCDLGMSSQDFITPADQFDVDCDMVSQRGVRQRSPAPLSPNKMKRARALSPARQNNQNTCPACGNCSQPKSKIKSNCLPPCYRSAFADNEEEEACMATWMGQKLRAPVLTGSRYRDDFKETGMLGQGSFSKVYSVRHRLDGKSYAIKRTLRGVARQSLEFAQFLQEVQILSNVPYHKGIIRYYGSWAEPCIDPTDGEKLFMQLELGNSTLKNLSLGEPLPESTLVQVGRQVLSALDHLHANGIAHMDLKPSNVVIVRQEDDVSEHLVINDGEVKLADFGQATACRKLKGHKIQELIVQEGDARYLPLEVMNSDYGHLDKADIFSLGAMLFELACGNELPHGGQKYEDLRRGKVPLLPTITTSFMHAIKCMLKHDPMERPSAAKLLSMAPFSKVVITLS